MPNRVERLPPGTVVSPLEGSERVTSLPEIVEVVRKRALEEAIEPHGLWGRAVLCRSVEEVTEPKDTHV